MQNRRNILQKLVDSYRAIRSETNSNFSSNPSTSGSQESNRHIEILESNLRNFPNNEPPSPYYWPTNTYSYTFPSVNTITAQSVYHLGMLIGFGLPQPSLIPYGTLPTVLQPNFHANFTNANFTNANFTNAPLNFESFLAASNRNNQRPTANKGAVYPKLNINGMQKKVIETTFLFIFREIETLKLKDALAALNAIVAANIDDATKDVFIEQNIWDVIQQARNILFAEQPERLLNLKIRNDDNTEVEKTGVQDYIRKLVAEQKLEVCQRHRAAKQIQLLFKAKLAHKKEREELSVEVQLKR